MCMAMVEGCAAELDVPVGIDTQVDEELEGYKKSGDKYLDKVDFLKRAELRQYEQERDQRLSQDMRSRGRL